MTLTARIAQGPPKRRPSLMTVEKHELVGLVMDHIALVQDAMLANGTAHQRLQRLYQLRPDTLVGLGMESTRDTHDALSRLLASLRESAGDWDDQPPEAA